MAVDLNRLSTIILSASSVIGSSCQTQNFLSKQLLSIQFELKLNLNKNPMLSYGKQWENDKTISVLIIVLNQNFPCSQFIYFNFLDLHQRTPVTSSMVTMFDLQGMNSRGHRLVSTYPYLCSCRTEAVPRPEHSFHQYVGRCKKA